MFLRSLCWILAAITVLACGKGADWTDQTGADEGGNWNAVVAEDGDWLRHRIPTADGAQLTVFENSSTRARGRQPVLFVSGMFATFWSLRNATRAAAEHGYDVWGMHTRWHGNGAEMSLGVLRPVDAHPELFDALRNAPDDIESVVTYIVEKTGQPPIIVGHSFGGQAALKFARGLTSWRTEDGQVLYSDAARERRTELAAMVISLGASTLLTDRYDEFMEALDVVQPAAVAPLIRRVFTPARISGLLFGLSFINPWLTPPHVIQEIVARSVAQTVVDAVLNERQFAAYRQALLPVVNLELLAPTENILRLAEEGFSEQALRSMWDLPVLFEAIMDDLNRQLLAYWWIFPPPRPPLPRVDIIPPAEAQLPNLELSNHFGTLPVVYVGAEHDPYTSAMLAEYDRDTTSAALAMIEVEEAGHADIGFAYSPANRLFAYLAELREILRDESRFALVLEAE